MSKITINKGSFKIEELELQHGTIVIGRSSNSDIQLDDLSVSNHHAKIITLFDATFIQDLDSTNGTFVNGKTVRKHTLHTGDVVTIGRHQILFQGSQEENDSDSEESTVVMDRAGMETMIADYKKSIKSNPPINRQPVMNSTAQTNQAAKAQQFVQPNTLKHQEQRDTAAIAKNTATFANDITTIAKDTTTIANDATTIAKDTTTIANDATTIAKDTTTIANDATTISKNSTTFAKDSTAFAKINPITDIDPITNSDPSDVITSAVVPKTVNQGKSPVIGDDNAFIPKETQKIFKQDATQEVSKSDNQAKPIEKNNLNKITPDTAGKGKVLPPKIKPKIVSSVVDPSVNKTAPYFGPTGVEQRQSVSDETMLKLIIKRDSEYSPKKNLYSSIQTVLAFLALAIFGAIMYITFT